MSAAAIEALEAELKKAKRQLELVHVEKDDLQRLVHDMQMMMSTIARREHIERLRAVESIAATEEAESSLVRATAELEGLREDEAAQMRSLERKSTLEHAERDSLYEVREQSRELCASLTAARSELEQLGKKIIHAPPQQLKHNNSDRSDGECPPPPPRRSSIMRNNASPSASARRQFATLRPHELERFLLSKRQPYPLLRTELQTLAQEVATAELDGAKLMRIGKEGLKKIGVGVGLSSERRGRKKRAAVLELLSKWYSKPVTPRDLANKWVG